MLVGWGGKPYVTEFARDGRVLFDAQLAVGDFYRAYRFRGTRARRPGRRSSSDDDTAYASWNGATEVASWDVRAGDDEAALRSVATVPKDGFETAIGLDTDAKVVAVRALDAAGRPLASSAAVAR